MFSNETSNVRKAVEKIQKKKGQQYMKLTVSFKPQEDEYRMFVYIQEKAKYSSISSVIKELIHIQMIRDGMFEDQNKKYLMDKIIELSETDR